MRRQTENRRAMRPHREAELGVESGVEIGQRLGVGLVECVLESASVTARQPVTVHMVVDQSELGDVLGEHLASRHRLQAIRNLSAQDSASRSE